MDFFFLGGWGWGGVFFTTFLEGSVDHVIYKDYIVNWHFFIYCNLATTQSLAEDHLLHNDRVVSLRLVSAKVLTTMCVELL